MTDQEIAILICQQLDLRIPLDPVLSGIAGLEVVQNFQPRQQGMSPSAIYFVKLFDKRYGYPHTKDVFVDPVPPDPVGTMQHIETQAYESHYQFMALLPQDPAVLNRVTESDALNIVAGIIAGDACRLALAAAGLGILRVLEVKNPFFQDDRDRWEASPSFDIVFTHERVRTTIDPVVSTYDATVVRV